MKVISELHLLTNAVTVSAEVGRYLQNIVVFLRLNRAVVGGISSRATRHFLLVAKCVSISFAFLFVLNETFTK